MTDGSEEIPHGPVMSRRKFLKSSSRAVIAAAIPRNPNLAPREQENQATMEIMDLSGKTREEIDDYVENTLNPQLEAKIRANPEMMKPGMSYYSIEVTKADYLSFKSKYGLTMEEFVQKHNKYLNNLLSEANDRAAANGFPRNIEGCICRRIVLLDPDIVTPSMADDDGYYRTNEGYDPTVTGYYDAATGIDRGFVHEVAHEIGFPDLYSLDFLWSQSNSQSVYREKMLARIAKETDIKAYREKLEASALRLIPPELEAIPVNWREYEGMKGFTTPDLMQGCDPIIDVWSAVFKSKSIKDGWSHDRERQNGLSAWSFPNEVRRDIAPKNAVKVGTKFAGKKIEVYQSTPPCIDKGWQLMKNGSGVVNNKGEFDIGNPFVRPENIPDDEYFVRAGMPAYGSVLLVVIRDSQDRITNWQYVDITAFNMAAWKGYTEKAVVGFNMADERSADPRDFNWGLTFSGEKSHQTFLSFITR